MPQNAHDTPAGTTFVRWLLGIVGTLVVLGIVGLIAFEFSSGSRLTSIETLLEAQSTAHSAQAADVKSIRATVAEIDKKLVALENDQQASDEAVDEVKAALTYLESLLDRINDNHSGHREELAELRARVLELERQRRKENPDP